MPSSHPLDPQLQEVFGRVFQLLPDQFSDRLRRGQTERWDSLGHLELIDALQQKFAIEISLDEALGMETLDDIRKIVAARMTTHAVSPDPGSIVTEP